MRICFVNTQQRWAGGERWFLWAAEAMRDRGHEVTMAVSEGSELSRRAEDVGIPFGPVGRTVGRAAGRLLKRIFQSRTPDAVVCSGGGEARSAVRARKGADTPRIVLRRGLCRDLGRGPVKAHFYRRLDGVFCNSRRTADVLIEAHPWLAGGKVTVMYNPVPSLEGTDSETRGCTLFALSAKDGELVVLSVGRLDEDKGHIFLVEAFHRALRDAPGLRLVIAGDGPQRPVLEQAVDRLELKDTVVLFGFAAYPAFFYGIADIFVMPSLPGYESFSNAALEAMSFGLPVIASTCGGFPELITDETDGLLTPPGDVDALAAALRTLAADADLRAQMGEAARKHVTADFSPGGKAEELESYLANVVDDA